MAASNASGSRHITILLCQRSDILPVFTLTYLCYATHTYTEHALYLGLAWQISGPRLPVEPAPRTDLVVLPTYRGSMAYDRDEHPPSLR